MGRAVDSGGEPDGVADGRAGEGPPEEILAAMALVLTERQVLLKRLEALEDCRDRVSVRDRLALRDLLAAHAGDIERHLAALERLVPPAGIAAA